MKRILIAFDGSEQAENALYEGVKIAKQNEAKVYVVQIIDDMAMLVNSPVPLADIAEEERKSAIKNLEEKLKAIDYPIESIIEIGKPKKMLAKTIPDRYQIDLIVMGATGRGAIERKFVGSTASYVINHGEANVLVVR